MKKRKRSLVDKPPDLSDFWGPDARTNQRKRSFWNFMGTHVVVHISRNLIEVLHEGKNVGQKNQVNIIILSCFFVRMFSRGLVSPWFLQNHILLEFTWIFDTLKFEEKVKIVYICNTFVVFVFFAPVYFKSIFLIWCCFYCLE